MEFGQDAMEQLSEELVSGYDLNAKLLALLRHGPLDRRGQEAATAMSQELSRVFMVSLFMLNSRASSRTMEERMASPSATVTEGSIDEWTPAKDMRICVGEEVAPPRKGRENEVTKKEITASPYNDAYQWRKYGQKNIHKRKFARSYYKCMFSHDRGCGAKKMVQQQDSSSGRRPMFQVTYVNEHKCQQKAVLPMGTTTNKNNMTKGSRHLDPQGPQPQHAGLDDDTMASCLAMIIGGAAPAGPSSLSLPPPPPVVNAPEAPSLLSSSSSLPVEASLSDPAVYVPAGGGHSPSTDAITVDDIYFPCGALFSPVAAQSISRSDDVPMAVAQFTASAWPRYS